VTPPTRLLVYMDDRRDDWRNGVDKKLVDLTSAQRSTDDELDDLGLKYDSLDRILRGDPETDISGFQERLHNVENGLQELRAEKVKSKLADTTVQGFKWQFWGIILAAAFTALGAYFSRNQIEALMDRPSTDPIQRREEEIENPKPHHHKHSRPTETTQE